jgi:hypothetical protein
MRLPLTKDDRFRPTVWLLAAAAAQVIAFWYPDYVANKYPSSDHDGRYFILPHAVFGAGFVAVASAIWLSRRLRRHSWLSSVGVVIVCSAAAIITLVPTVILFRRLFCSDHG